MKRNFSWKVILLIALALILGEEIYYLASSERWFGLAGGGRQHVLDLRNFSFTLEDEEITLNDGTFVAAVPESSAQETFRLMSVSASGDLNGDGADDVASIVTHDAGGSGTFYYLVAAFANAGRLQGLNAQYLGDRIKVTDVAVDSAGVITVEYLDRGPNEPFSAPPDIQAFKQFRAVDGRLVLIEREKNIAVEEPKAGASLQLPFVISGQARTFEQNVRIRIKDGSGVAVLDTFTTAVAEDIGQWGAFSFEVSEDALGEYRGQSVLIEVFEESAEDGSEKSLTAIPVAIR
jgi:hypothetical protein